MIHTLRAVGGMVVAPHHPAAQAGRDDILREGGNAVEAMVAAAADRLTGARGPRGSATSSARAARTWP